MNAKNSTHASDREDKEKPKSAKSKIREELSGLLQLHADVTLPSQAELLGSRLDPGCRGSGAGIAESK